MKTVFVSRHPGAAEWAARHMTAGVEVVPHFTPTDEPVKVAGTLPVHLAAAVCAAGGEYWHLSMDIPPELRGVELTADQMEQCGCRFEQYTVKFAPLYPTGDDWNRAYEEGWVDGLTSATGRIS